MKKIVILSTLLSLVSFSSKIKLSLNENYTATMENDKALIPVIFKDKLDENKLHNELNLLNSKLTFLNYENDIKEKIGSYTAKIVLNKGYDIYKKRTAKTEKEAIQDLILDLKDIKGAKLVSFDIEKKYDIDKCKINKKYLVEVDNLNKINNILDVLKKYNGNISNPKYVSNDATNLYSKILSKTDLKAKNIANILGYKLQDNIDIEELKDNKHIYFDRAMYLSESNSNFKVDDAKTTLNANVTYTLVNNAKDEYKSSIKIYGTATEYITPKSVNIQITVDNDEILNQLKEYDFKTKIYNTYEEVEKIPTENYIQIKLEASKINDMEYLINNIDSLTIKAKSEKKVNEILNETINKFKKHGITVIVKEKNIIQDEKEIRQKKVYHVLSLNVNSMEKFNKIYLDLVNKGIKNIDLKYEIDDSSVYQKALYNALDKLKTFKGYSIRSIKEIKDDSDYYDIPVKLTRNIIVEAGIER